MQLLLNRLADARFLKLLCRDVPVLFCNFVNREHLIGILRKRDTVVSIYYIEFSRLGFDAKLDLSSTRSSVVTCQCPYFD